MIEAEGTRAGGTSTPEEPEYYGLPGAGIRSRLSAPRRGSVMAAWITSGVGLGIVLVSAVLRVIRDAPSWLQSDGVVPVGRIVFEVAPAVPFFLVLLLALVFVVPLDRASSNGGVLARVTIAAVPAAVLVFLIGFFSSAVSLFTGAEWTEVLDQGLIEPVARSARYLLYAVIGAFAAMIGARFAAPGGDASLPLGPRSDGR